MQSHLKKNIIVHKLSSILSIQKVENKILRIFEYVLAYMIFDEKNISNKFVTDKILIEIHFVNDLKINLLIDIDVFKSQKISINFDNNIVYIKTYEIKTLINSHIKKDSHIKRIIRVKKTFIIYLKTTNVFITYNENLLNDRNFLFESYCSENLNRENEVYAHIIDFLFFLCKSTTLLRSR